MAEVWFYHLERQPAEEVLPLLLARGLERGLRLSVETKDEARVKALSQKLWAAEDVAFTPHGYAGEPSPETQPVYIAASPENPNGSAYRFYVDGSAPESLGSLQRASILFDGQDEQMRENARVLWRRFKAEGCDIKYWKQDENGRWQDQAAKSA